MCAIPRRRDGAAARASLIETTDQSAQSAARTTHRDDRPPAHLRRGVAPSNVADLLDTLVIHVPTSDTDLGSLRLVCGYAAVGKPLLLGETFFLYCGGETERRLLLEANRYLAGTFEFFDGRDPNHMSRRP